MKSVRRLFAVVVVAASLRAYAQPATAPLVSVGVKPRAVEHLTRYEGSSVLDFIEISCSVTPEPQWRSVGTLFFARVDKAEDDHGNSLLLHGSVPDLSRPAFNMRQPGELRSTVGIIRLKAPPIDGPRGTMIKRIEGSFVAIVPEKTETMEIEFPPVAALPATNTPTPSPALMVKERTIQNLPATFIGSMQGNVYAQIAVVIDQPHGMKDRQWQTIQGQLAIGVKAALTVTDGSGVVKETEAVIDQVETGNGTFRKSIVFGGEGVFQPGSRLKATVTFVSQTKEVSMPFGLEALPLP